MLSRVIGIGFCIIAAFSMPEIGQSQAHVASTSGVSVSDLMPPTHPCTPAQVREYMQLNGTVARTLRLMNTMIDTARTTSDKAIPAAMWDDMKKSFSVIDFAALATPAYQRYLSEEDMASIIVFYKTDAGRRILESSPYIESLSAKAGQEAGQKIGSEVGARYAAEIAERRKQLDKEAADRAGKSSDPAIQLKQAPQ